MPQALQALWNRWLLSRYKGRAGLADAWTTDSDEVRTGPAASKSVCALLPAEGPEKGTVDLAGCWPRPEEDSADTAGGVRSPLRVCDATRFLAEIERAYYDKFYKHLRWIGVKCPIVRASASTT